MVNFLSSMRLVQSIWKREFPSLHKPLLVLLLVPFFGCFRYLFIYLFIFVFVYIFMYRRRKDATVMLPTKLSYKKP